MKHKNFNCILLLICFILLIKLINNDNVDMNYINSFECIIKRVEQLKQSEELGKIQQGIRSQGINSIQYPNDECEELVRSITGSLESRITLIGYGSLMTPGTSRSQNDEISAESYKTMREVVVFGWKRVFNWDVRVGGQFPATYVSYENEQASLNAVPAQGAYFNAVAIDVTAEELSKLRKREIGYDMVTVPYALFQRRDDMTEIFHKAVMFSASNEPRQSFKDPVQKVVYTNDTIAPRRFYHDLVSSICLYKRSKEFFEMYSNTTFMADGKQLAAEWRAKARVPTKEDVERDVSQKEAIEKVMDYEPTRESYWKNRFCN